MFGPIVEAFSVVLRWLTTIWELVEPILSVEGPWRWSVVGALAILVIVVWKKRRRKLALVVSPVLRALGPSPTLSAASDYLAGLVTEYSSAMQLPPHLALATAATAQDLKDETLRLYFFGHQNAGKSSLVNALLGASLSPKDPGKLTACLVRVKYGPEPRLTFRWENGTEETAPFSALEKRMARWAESTQRPREVIVETPREILGTRNTELVDSPGTGSAWSEEFEKSIEDELVTLAVRSAAVAIVVYRYETSELEAHDRLLRQLGGNKIPTFGVCNLDPNWASEYQVNRRNLEKVIDRAEGRLRELARARCYRIPVEDRTEVLAVAKQADTQTVELLRNDLIALMKDRRNLVVRQAVIGSRSMIDDLLQVAHLQIESNYPLVERLEQEKVSIFNGIAAVKSVLGIEVDQSYTGTYVGAGIGGAAGLWGAATTAATALTVATGGLILGLAAIGAGIGLAVDAKRKRDFKKRLRKVWEELQQICRNTTLVRRAVIKTLATAPDSMPRQQYAKLVIDLELHVLESLGQVPEYRMYSSSKELESTLKELRLVFGRFA